MAGCPTIPLSCLTPEKIFAGVYRPNCGGFADPSNFQAERAIFNSQFGELINNYGVTIGYMVNTFEPDQMNSIYGEHTTMYWLSAMEIKAYIQMENGSPIYALAGMDSPDTLTLYLHIDEFETKFGSLSYFQNHPVEPKSQDKIIVYPFGCDRPNGRSAKIFEVTEAMDEDQSELNPAMGHYVWRLKAVRSEHNFVTNEPREAFNQQIADNSYFGKISSVLFPELSSALSANKIYTENSDDIVRNEIFPPSTGGSDGSIYGNYF
jgi:hypothetical protein